MTVKDLIIELLACPMDAKADVRVEMHHDGGNDYDIAGVTVLEVTDGRKWATIELEDRP